MKRFDSDRPGSQDIAWCPGCGNFALRAILMETLEELDLNPQQVVIVSGIGQAAKMPHYLKINSFHTLHGRAIPIATGVKIANPQLIVIAEGGDGDMYAEGGNHFIHAIRRNPDITVIIHNNQVYGLTKGQASPTSLLGMKTPAQPEGVFETPFNAMAVAIALESSFVARSFVGEKELTKNILKEAILNKGLSIVEIFQPCVTFNRLNTYEWYKENTYILKEHNPEDRFKALEIALAGPPYALGVLYKKEKKDFNSYIKRENPMYLEKPAYSKLQKIFEKFK